VNLPRFGWEAIVLSVDRPSADEAVWDPESLARLPKTLEVYRTPWRDVTRIYLKLRAWGFPNAAYYASRLLHYLPSDHCGLWVPYAVEKGRRLIAARGIQALYSTSGPLTNHWIAMRLARESGLPWVADFRDLWSQDPERRPPTSVQRLLDRWLEGRVLEHADRVIASTHGYADRLASLRPAPERGKFHTIYNGFDFEPATPIPVSNPALTIGYAGQFYSFQQPDTLLAAIDELIEEGRIPEKRIRFRVIGGGIETALRRFAGRRVCRVVENLGMRPHSEVPSFLRSVDVLLLIVGRERGPHNVPGKTFEYLASGRPILGLFEAPCELGAVLERTAGLSGRASPKDVRQMKQVVWRLFHLWADGRLPSGAHPERLAEFRPEFLTARLARILDEISPARNGRRIASCGLSTAGAGGPA